MADPRPRAHAVLRGEPDAYDMRKQKLMGRQAAGHGFLRAAVHAREGHPVIGMSRGSGSAKGFAAIVAEIDPEAPVEWIPVDQFNRVAQTGVLYLAGGLVMAWNLTMTILGHKRNELPIPGSQPALVAAE